MIALVIQGESDRSVLADEVAAYHGCHLPSAPGVDGIGVEAIWAGQDRWMLVSSDRSRRDEIFGGPVSRSECVLLDQSSGWLLVTLRGPGTVATLRKGLQIDVDPLVFKPGAAALTPLDHIWTCVWRPKNEAQGYRMLMRRSFSRAFRHWFEVSALEFGFSISAD
jgi:heterotetrameric sarcosine oxidase gamma subunit